MKIGTYEASKMLGCSRTDVVKLMKAGHIDYKISAGQFWTTEDDVRIYQGITAEQREKRRER